MGDKKVRILFNVWADQHNRNAQSLNARELALRLNPSKFESALFCGNVPDERLVGRPDIKLIRLPSRLGTLRVVAEMLSGYDIVFYTQSDRASYLYLRTPKVVRRHATSILCVEGLIRGNLETASASVRSRFNYCLRASDITTAVSEKIATDTEEFCGARPRYVTAVGVDRSVFYPGNENQDNRAASVLFVGHLIERKGPLTMLHAARRFPGAQFHLVGSARGDYQRVLMERAQEWRLANLTLHGEMDQNTLAELMRASDVLMLPSRVEGLPKVTLEAAACGLPCLVYDDYETPSVLNNVTGFQVKTEDEMLTRLEELLSSPGRRNAMGKEAARHADQFDWDVVARKWERIFEILTGGPESLRERSFLSHGDPGGEELVS